MNGEWYDRQLSSFYVKTFCSSTIYYTRTCSRLFVNVSCKHKGVCTLASARRIILRAECLHIDFQLHKMAQDLRLYERKKLNYLNFFRREHCTKSNLKKLLSRSLLAQFKGLEIPYRDCGHRCGIGLLKFYRHFNKSNARYLVLAST